MPRVEHNKLVRDYIPEKIRKSGDVCEVRTLRDDEFVGELRKKIIEEAQELSLVTTREGILSEYADLMVVLDAFTRKYEFSEADIKEALEQNIKRKGLFNERHFLISTDDATI